MKQPAGSEQASKTDSSRHTEPSARPLGIALAPPDYRIDSVDHQSASAGPIQLNSHPRVLQQKTLFDGIRNSPRVTQQTALMDQIANSSRVITQRQRMDRLFGARDQRRDMEDLPREPETAQRVVAETTVSRRESAPGSPVPLAAFGPKPNNTGLPDGLKSSVESLSGMPLDDVKVHYNSSRPAQLNALAYAQGSDIHIAPGQERHLPHEAWHVVQQAQGRVEPTMQLKGGVPVNDDEGLEHEADVMGTKASQMRHHPEEELRSPAARQPALQRMTAPVRRDLGRDPTAELTLQRQIAVIQRHHNYGGKLTDGTLDDVLIYKVVDNDGNAVYIGQTCEKQGLDKRFDQHIKSKYHTNWSYDTHSIKRLEAGNWTILEAKVSEQYWIDYFLDKDAKLENARHELTYETWKFYRDDKVTTPTLKGNYHPKKT